MAEFEIPDFLENRSTDEVHSEMLDALPEDIDKSQGQFPWDVTRPTALEVSYFAEYTLVEALKQIFPEFAYGDFLDYHADSKGLIRKSATYSIGYVTVTGDADTVIPAGSVFSTESTNTTDSIDFETSADVTIPQAGTIIIPVQCAIVGSEGNVAAGTIILNSSDVDGITDITNVAATQGGTDEEDDDSLRLRIIDQNRESGISCVGRDSDYKAWALSVDGTGSATVIPAQDNSGLVTIVLLDANGNPASAELCQQVYNYIVSPDEPSQRLVTINGANLSVVAPTVVDITVSATVEIESTTTINAVKDLFCEALKIYLIEAVNNGEIKYSKVGAILSAIEGVSDYASLTVNGGTVNITIASQTLPVASSEDITLTEGTI